MSRKDGIEFFPLEVGITDTDDKIFALMENASRREQGQPDDSSWLAFGRYVGLLSQIYAEGWAIQLDDRKAFRIATKLGFANANNLFDFVGVCLSAGLFDRDLWETERVLTSAGIQKRYLAAKKRSKAVIEGPWALLGPTRTCSDQSRAISDNCMQVSEDVTLSDRVADTCPKSPAKDRDKRELSKREEEDEEESSSSPGDEEAEGEPLLPCMATELEGCVFRDSAGDRHRTPLVALMASYAHSVGNNPGDLGGGAEYASKVQTLCPAHCRGDPNQVKACYEAVLRALERFSPAKGSDPWPLTKTILEQDRRVPDG